MLTCPKLESEDEDPNEHLLASARELCCHAMEKVHWRDAHPNTPWIAPALPGETIEAAALRAKQAWDDLGEKIDLGEMDIFELDEHAEQAELWIDRKELIRDFFEG
jgi:hypothetical protein